jgi:Raf kinase inhibitor-like YbhB/YbcL family protein
MRIRFLLGLVVFVSLIGLAFRSAAGHPTPQDSAVAVRQEVQPAVTSDWQGAPQFRLTSTTFMNNQTLPLSTIFEAANPNGTNACTLSGATGGNESPELMWTGAPPNTVTFAVILYDVTAAFTHWGIYDITPNTYRLPENSGVPGTSQGAQITDDFGLVGYNGPCPPAGLTHQYVFTVYAVDTHLKLPSAPGFPVNSETLFRGLIGHVISSASLTGYFSTTPPSTPGS